MLIVKAHAVLHKIERGKEALDEAFALCMRLKSPELCAFIEICRAINDEEISMKKRTQSVDSVRKRRSRLSVGSHLSSKTSVDTNATQDYFRSHLPQSTVEPSETVLV